MDEKIKVNIPSSIWAEVGFDDLSAWNDGTPEGTEITKEIKRWETEKHGKGKSLVLRLTPKTAAWLANLLHDYADTTGLDPDCSYRRPVCLRAEISIRRSLMQRIN